MPLHPNQLAEIEALRVNTQPTLRAVAAGMEVRLHTAYKVLDHGLPHMNLRAATYLLWYRKILDVLLHAIFDLKRCFLKVFSKIGTYTRTFEGLRAIIEERHIATCHA